MPIAADDVTVSAVIPAYNSARDIARAIESCLQQTRPPDEIIVVDDGSTDNTARVAAQFGASVSVVTQPNGGPASARNRGVADAKGDWIALLDADDWWLPTKLDKQLGLVTAPNVALVHSLSDDRGDPPPPVLSFGDLWRRNWIVNSSVLLRRSALDAVGGFDEDRQLISVEDYNLWLRIAAAGWTIVTCPEILVHYSRGDGLSSNSEGFLAASLYNVDVLEKGLALPASQAEAKRAGILADFGRQALYGRELPLARRLLWRSLAAQPSLEIAVRLAAANLPRAVLNLRRTVRRQVRHSAHWSAVEAPSTTSPRHSSRAAATDLEPQKPATFPRSASIIDAGFTGR